MTTVFEGVDTGPGIYAHYLWHAFRECPDIEFHVVAPMFVEGHPRLHSSGAGRNSLDLYRLVQAKALEVARMPSDSTTIVHGNSTHGMGLLTGHVGPLVTQVNDYETATFPATALRLARDSGIRKLASTAWRYREERRVLRCATVALCNSEYTSRIVRRCYGLPPNSFRVLHKAVDTRSFERPRVLPSDPFEMQSRGGRLVFVGSDWHRKGLDVLLRAVANLATKVPSVSLAVVGPERSDAGLLALINSLGLSDRVLLVGKVSREVLVRHLWHADVFVLPSRREALGVAVLEGMAAGLPVVASATGGIPEMVRSGVDGHLVTPGQVEELTKAMESLLADPDLRAAMGAAGRMRAQEFSVETMTKGLLRIYQEALHMSPPTIRGDRDPVS